MLKMGDRVRTTVRNFGAQGEGVCVADGVPVFVPGALPGEEISAVITQAKTGHAFGRLQEIFAASPDRTEPICPYYSACGGCGMMHMRYERTLEAKAEMVKNALWHIGRVPPDSYELERTVPSPMTQGYRNKAVYHVDQENLSLGFYAQGSRRVAPIGACLLQTPQSNGIKRTVERWMKRYGHGGLQAVMTRTAMRTNLRKC